MRFEVLGDVKATGLRRAHLGRSRQHMFLAMLLTRVRSPVPIDTLVDGLWEGEPLPSSPRSAIHTVVSRLRGALDAVGADGAVLVVARGDAYVLEAPLGALDGEEFERLVAEGSELHAQNLPDRALKSIEAALGLWTGPAYGDFADREWARTEAQRLEARRVDAVELLAELKLELGDHRSLPAQLESMCVAHPYRERLRSLLMLALYRSGRHSEALGAYQSYRHQLAQDLGLDPSPDLTQLEHQILVHDPILDPPIRTRAVRGYLLSSRLGDGPHGEVWIARQPTVGREIAIKMLNAPDDRGDDFNRNFERDAQVLARLEHPFVVPLIDAWRDADGAYLVTRLMRGGSLAERLAAITAGRRPAIGPTQAQSIIARVDGALRAARAVGVSHGHVVATNVLFDETDTAYLADFGLPCLYRNLGNAERDAELDDEIAVEHLARLLGVERAMAKPPTPATQVNPYRGLATFDEADASRFFGRKQMIETLRVIVDHNPMTAVVGSSGSGKSSLVRAGLVPILRRDGAASPPWWPLVITPGHDPKAAIAAALGIPAGMARTSSLDELLAAGIAGADSRPLLVIDQFEELYTLAAPKVCNDFVAELVHTAIRQSHEMRVVLVVRADLFERPLASPGIGELLRTSVLPVGPMTASELREVIVRPLADTGVTIEEAVVAELIAAVGGRHAALPLLQFTLFQLFDDCRGRTITVEQFRGAGELSGVIASRAESVLAVFADEVPVIRRLFSLLVNPGATGPDTRRTVALQEVLAEPSASIQRIVDGFVAARLITIDADPTTRAPTLELAHEALLTEWPRLVEWLDQDRDILRSAAWLRRVATDWSNGDRDKGTLLRGGSLERAIALVECHPSLVSPVEHGLVETSRDAARSAHRWRMTLATAMMVLVALAVISGSIAMVQRSHAEARARNETTARTASDVARLSFQSRALAGRQLDLALLLAVEAFRRDGGPSGEAALFTTLGARPQITRLVRVSEDSAQLRTLGSRSGTLLAVVDDTVIVYHSRTMQPTGLSWSIEPESVAAISRDGTLAATVNSDGVIERRALVDRPTIESPDVVLSLPGLSSPSALAFLDDGQLLVAVGREVAVIGTQGEPLSRITLDSAPSTLTVSPSGRHVAAIANRTLWLIDLQAGTAESIPGYVDVTATAFSEDGNSVFVIANDVLGTGVLYELRLEDRATLRDRSLPFHAPDRIITTASGGLIIASAVGQVAAIDSSWQTTRLFEVGANSVTDGVDGQLIAAYGGSLAVIDLGSRGVLTRPLSGQLRGSITVSADGSRFAIQTLKGPQVLSTDTLHPVGPPLQVSLGLLSMPILSPDGATVAAVGLHRTELIDVTTGMPLGEPLLSVGAWPAFSDDGRRVAIGGLAGVVIYEVRSMRVVAAVPSVLSQAPATELSWSPDGRQLAITQPTEPTRIVEPGTQLPGVEVGSTGAQVRWSPDGSKIAVFDALGLSRVVDASTLELIDKLDTATRPVALARWISNDQVAWIRLNDQEGAAVEVATPGASEASAPGLTIANPGQLIQGTGGFTTNRQLIVGNAGELVLVVDLDPTTWVRRACELAGRNLTHREWEQYLAELGPWRATCTVS